MNNRRTTRPSPPARWFACAAMIFFLVACGSESSDEVRAASAVEPTESAVEPTEVVPAVVPEPTIAPTAAPTATAEPTALPTPAPPGEDVVPLESVYDEPVLDGGWPVAAGVWSSSSFSTPLQFELPADATLLSDGLGRLEFAVGPADQPDGWLYIVEPTALNRPTGPIPIDLIDPVKAFDGATILGETMSEGPLGEFTLTDFRPDMAPVLEPFTRPCFRRPGRRCIAPYMTASGQNGVMFTMDGIHRVAGFPFGEEGRLNVIAVVNDETDTSFLDYADELAASLWTVDTSWSGTTSLDTLGMRGETLPAGQWVRGVGSTLMTIDLVEDLAVDPLLFPELDVIGIEAGAGVMFLMHHDPRYDLASGSLPIGAGAWTPATGAEVEAAIGSAADSFEVAEVTFAGLPAVEFSNAVFGDGQPCPQLVTPVPPGSQCTVWFRSASSQFYSYDDPDSVQRLIYVEDLGLLVFIKTPVDDDGSAAAFEALEAALTLTPMN